MIWNFKMEDILNGYREDDSKYYCIICDKEYEQGRIYKIENELYDANGAVIQQFEREHKNIAAYLLEQELNLTGISEIQRNLLELILEGDSDKEISKKMGIVQSTVRNHRFKLKEKEKQAKLFLVLMKSIEKETNKYINKTDHGLIEGHHQAATMVAVIALLRKNEKKQ